jgi:thiamine biosynthesis lipoprotein ApbE
MKRRGILLFLAFILAGCAGEVSIKETRLVMDTFCEISCFSVDRDKAAAAIEDAFKEIERVEKAFSKFDENSEVSRLNRLAGYEGVNVSEEVFSLTERSLNYSVLSGGAFDITIAPLMEIWGFTFREGSIPDKGAIESVLKIVGYKKIALDPENSSIRFLNKDVKVDFGGIAKGYAVDRAKDMLVSHGIKNSLVNLGGNIFASGNPPGRTAWKIGVEDPRNKEKLLHSFELSGKAISTSGNYERFFEINGKRYSHIMNPLTGEPCRGIISVTVIAVSAEEADALSTAIFVMGEEKGMEFAGSVRDINVLILKEDGGLILY